MVKKSAYQSPIKDMPLRNPGQSIHEQRLEMIFDHLLPAILFPVILVTVAAIEWIRYLFPTQPSIPWFGSSLAFLSLGYPAWKFYKYWPQIERLRQAERGEKSVGQFLERLREQGYQVFHDVLGKDFNLDHIVIGPGGVFTLETKTWSKPIKGEAVIVFDGENLSVPGRTLDRDPIIQASAQANWLRQLLQESTGKKFPVRPVLLFPGWFVKSTKERRSETWILEPKALPAFLENAPQCVEFEDIKLASYHLSRYIREEERRRNEAK